MMIRYFSALLCLYCLLGIGSTQTFAAEQAKSDAVLESISYEKDENNAEIIIFKLNGTHIPKIFKIKGEKPRLVFDFIDTRYSDLINNIINTEGNLIKGVRVGIHNDPPKTRVVVDLKAEKEYEIEQDFLEQDNILTITFNPDGQRRELQTKETVKDTTSEKTKKADDKKEQVSKAAPADSEKPQQKSDEVVAVERDQSPRAETAQQEVSAPAVQPPDQPPEKPSEKQVEEGTKQEDERIAASDEVNAILAQMTEKQVAPADPILRDVTFERTANDSEMVLFKLNDFYPPIVFGIEKGNPRVVCDFLDTILEGDVKPVIRTNGVYVSRIRTAKHNDPAKVRVVLDLVPNRNYDLQQVFFKEDNLFVIIISEFIEEPAASVSIPENPTR